MGDSGQVTNNIFGVKNLNYDSSLNSLKSNFVTHICNSNIYNLHNFDFASKLLDLAATLSPLLCYYVFM